ncbi:MAG: efflux RND transporter periplasmic adaptor subunit [Sphingobacteriia bacterium]|nr:efflux RND transporter periplasmic adaptor subunit [Sphingobacteriia bacterium]
MKNLIIAGVLGSIFFSCQRDEEVQSVPFELSQTMLNEIQTTPAQILPVEEELLLNGKITFNEDKVARVFPLTGGFVKELKVELGDYVDKGQVLALVRSPEIAGYTKEEIEALALKKTAEKKLQVSEELFRSGIISELELTEARKDLERAIGEYNRIQDVLDMYSVSKGAIYPIKSPVSGYVIKKDISLNMELRTEDISPAFVVGSLAEVWVMANIYESDISKVQRGAQVDVKTISYPDKVFQGRIDKVFNLLDPESKTLKARVVLANPNLWLKPEMFASVRVAVTGSDQKLAVPAHAVLFDKNKHVVMVFKSKNKIETRQVEVYSENSKYAYLESGLKPGEQVITKHQLLIYDALND